ncbi:bile acid:sodium symporter family protein [Lysinibacillus sphaericus]|uniref:Bile acid:sodium symporter n=1 Tax=Lysinibacillus sphaericus OT4b.31 TaxID=1285586 RepID=R7ZD08_LYSSH|nr:bile acid:sodium symporter family protein [Lysinibacillus sphaericus]EON72020.1 bile acid:sodium symporter [Lysinibacillus sphaericus OT4b.31]
MKALERFSEFGSKTFAIWVLLFAAFAFFVPSGFSWIAAYITILLGIVMFGMGLTITVADFKEVLTRPKDVAVGIVGQFLIMPSLAFLLVKIFNLPPEIAIGVILVGCCPGGTSSNVMTFLSKGDVALSVTITSITTLLAPIVTPGLIYLFASEYIDVAPSALFMSIVKVIIIPIALGFIVQKLFNKQAKASVKVMPLVSVVAIVAIVAAVVAGNQQKIAETGLTIFAVVVLHNSLGYLIGYLFGKMFGMNLAKKKAIAIEVGMQNSGLGASLAVAHFSPLAAVPSAIFSVWHNISGPILATVFSRMKDKNT